MDCSFLSFGNFICHPEAVLFESSMATVNAAAAQWCWLLFNDGDAYVDGYDGGDDWWSVLLLI